MTSGLVALTAWGLILTPPSSSKSLGWAAPLAVSSSTFSLVQGSMPEPSVTPQVCLEKPSGMMPSARRTSWLAQATVATLVASAGTSVVP